MRNNLRRGRFRRGIYVLPTLFTIGTIFCGFYAVTSALKGEFNLAAIAIGFAVVFDGLDGRIARMTNSCSEFGGQIDSLADVVTFGLAPAILAYLWGVRALSPESPYSLHLQQIGWIVCFGFLVCGAMRLARYNIQSTKPSPSGSEPEKPFVGMPIPAGAAMIAAAVHFAPEPLEHWVAGTLWNLLVGFLAYLMVSTLKYPSFKHVDLKSRKRYVHFVLLAMLMALIYYYSQIVLLLMAAGYAFSGLGLKAYGLIKHKPEGVLAAGKLRSDDS